MQATVKKIEDDPGELPVDRLELYFLLKSDLKHLLLVSHGVVMSSAGCQDGARVLARAANRFARTAEAFADTDVLSREKP